jgi:hypothetical protein
MKPPRIVTLNDEDRRAGTLASPERLRGPSRVSPPPVLLQRHAVIISSAGRGLV